MAAQSQLMFAVSWAPTIIIIALVVLGAYVRYRRSVKCQYPPGPMTLPLLGNVHQLPMDYQQRKLAEWGRQYGDVVFAKFFRTPTVILNSKEAAIDLMEKRGAKYSDRPPLILLKELMGWDSVLNNLPYGDRFHKHRKWLQDAFKSKQVLMSYHPIQRRETYTLLSGLCDSPELFKDHIERWAAAIMLEITYGYRVTSLDDQLVETVKKATVETTIAGSPGSMLVDFFPILKGIPLWMPGSDFKRQAFYVKSLVRQTLDIPFDIVKRAMMKGTATPSFTAALIEEALAKGILTAEHEEDIKGAAGVIHAAGTDTTVTVMKTFVLAMLLHPDVYKKAQTEIDRVIGPERLPDFEDREHLPYLECVLKEVFRWNAPVPLGVPHRVISDDEYRGYHIPDGAMIIPNIWWMTQNPDAYPEPARFNPDRYMNMSTTEAESADPKNVVFGFGRRVCPGQIFADCTIWLAAANIIASMDLSYDKDNFGRDIIPPPAFISGFVSHPEAFTCSFVPRTQKIRGLIAHSSAVNIVTS